ncbi:FG-GAP repeat protein [Candidatus Poribacteria bacterium]|nr:FG-GAP repeat protein [Candidatus Poribacteria bacterium]
MAACSLAHGEPGVVVTERKIAQGLSGFTGPLADSSLFGSAIAALGDLDGDGVGELAVGAAQDPGGGTSRGAVWILFLGADGSVKSGQKIGESAGGFAGALADGSLFGAGIAAVGDLDGDSGQRVAAEDFEGRSLFVVQVFVGEIDETLTGRDREVHRRACVSGGGQEVVKRASGRRSARRRAGRAKARARAAGGWHAGWAIAPGAERGVGQGATEAESRLEEPTEMRGCGLMHRPLPKVLAWSMVVRDGVTAPAVQSLAARSRY